MTRTLCSHEPEEHIWRDRFCESICLSSHGISLAVLDKWQSITVQDVDLSIDDVSRLREAWQTTLFQPGGSVDNSGSDDVTRRNSIGSPKLDGRESDVRLVFAGKDLEKGQPLRRYGLSRNSTVHILGRVKGGAQLGKVVKGRSQVRFRML